MSHKSSAMAAVIAASLLLAGGAAAEPFSVQGFTGSGQEMDALPGVRFDPSTGDVRADNCERRRLAFHERRRGPFSDEPSTVVECSVGNFTFSTSAGNDSYRPTMHNRYGKTPMVGWEAWRP